MGFFLNATCNSTLDDLRIGTSEEVLAGGMTFHTIGIIIGAGFTLIAVLFSFYLIFMHAIHYTQPREQRHIIRILFMVPIYSVASFLTFVYYWHAIYFEVMYECYEAFAIASFFALLCHYIAPDLHQQKQFFRTLKPKPWVLPISWFLKCCGGERGPWRTPRSGLTWFNIIWTGIYQYCFIRVTMTITAVITQHFDKYCDQSYSPVFAHVWLVLIESAAVTVAMYCVIQFYIQTRVDLAPFQPLLKVIAIKAVIFLSFWQTILISFLTSSSINIVKASSAIAVPDLKIGIPALLLVFEMAVFSILHIFAFPWKPYSDDAVAPIGPDKVGNVIGPKQGGFLGIKALADAMNPWDLVKSFARGVRWLFVGLKNREKDSSYNTSAYDLNNPNNENDMTLGVGADGYKRSDSLPIANEFRRSKFGMPLGSSTKLDDEGAGLISHAQPNPGAGGYMPARERYDANGQEIRHGPSYDTSPDTSPDRLQGRNPPPGAMRRQENNMYGEGIGMAITAPPEPYRSYVSPEPYAQQNPQSEAYLGQKRQARQQAPPPSQQWANSSQPIDNSAHPEVHNALWGSRPPPNPRDQEPF